MMCYLSRAPLIQELCTTAGQRALLISSLCSQVQKLRLRKVKGVEQEPEPCGTSGEGSICSHHHCTYEMLLGIVPAVCPRLSPFPRGQDQFFVFPLLYPRHPVHIQRTPAPPCSRPCPKCDWLACEAALGQA